MSLCKCDPCAVFDLLQQQLVAADTFLRENPPSSAGLFVPPASASASACSRRLSWQLQKLGLIKLQMHIGFCITYQVPPLQPTPTAPLCFSSFALFSLSCAAAGLV